MHILMTDVLVCPRCGPAFGLILLADEIRERRVLRGRLGCPNCREQYPVAAGVVDLGGQGGANSEPDDRAMGDSGAPADGEEEAAAIRIAALLGITQGPAYVLLVGGPARHARVVRDALADVEVIALGTDAGERHIEEAGLSRVVTTGESVPVATGRMHGVAVMGEAAGALLEEVARTVRPTGRLLLDPAPPDAAGRLTALGLRVLAHEGTVLLAVRG